MIREKGTEITTIREKVNGVWTEMQTGRKKIADGSWVTVYSLAEISARTINALHDMGVMSTDNTLDNLQTLNEMGVKI